jgi:hypothetical protein
MSSGIDSVLKLLTSRPAVGLIGVGGGALLFAEWHWPLIFDENASALLLGFRAFGMVAVGGGLGLAAGSGIAAFRKVFSNYKEKKRAEASAILLSKEKAQKDDYIKNTILNLSSSQRSYLFNNFIIVELFYECRVVEPEFRRVCAELHDLKVGNLNGDLFTIDKDFLLSMQKQPNLLRA